MSSADVVVTSTVTRRARRLAAAETARPDHSPLPPEIFLTDGAAFSVTAGPTTPRATPERETAAEVLAAAVLAEGRAPLTRRELRAAIRREAGIVEAGSTTMAAHVMLQQESVGDDEPADQPVDLEFDFAAVALTLSSLAVAPRVTTTATPTIQVTPELQRRVSGSDDPPRAGRPAARASDSGGPTARQWVPRLAVLSALGVATVITPIHAMAGSEAEPEVVEIPLADASALDTLVATPQSVATATPAPLAARGAASAAPADQSPVDETAALLAADPLADVRSVAAASRSVVRSELPQCGAEESAQPNGALAALESTDHLTLSMPIQEGVYRITSGFGPRWGSVHYGTDFAAPVGTPIRAVAAGEVIQAGGAAAGRSPNLISIRSEIDGETVEIWYNHMFDDGVLVEEGDVVEVGDVIGKVGNNGNSTGPHLHLEVHVGNVSDPNGSAVDSLAWLRTNAATPVTTSGAVCV